MLIPPSSNAPVLCPASGPRVLASAALEIGSVRVRRVEYAPGLVQVPHAHDAASITLVAAGVLEETTPCARRRAGPGDCATKPAGVRHADEFGTAPVATLLLEPVREREFLPELGPPLEYRWESGGTLARAMFALLGSMSNGESELEERVDGVLAALPGEERATGAAPPWLADAEDLIEDELDRPLRVRALANAVGVHPIHLARVFRRVHGLGPTEYVQRSRTRAATRLLRTTSADLAEVAFRVGLCDQAHLCRLFARWVGLSPARYRVLVRTAPVQVASVQDAATIPCHAASTYTRRLPCSRSSASRRRSC